MCGKFIGAERGLQVCYGSLWVADSSLQVFVEICRYGQRIAGVPQSFWVWTEYCR
jgi:hypothetical protein